MLLQVGVKYGGEDIPGSPFPMSSNPSLDDVTSGSPEKMRNNKNGEEKLYIHPFFARYNGNRPGDKALGYMPTCKQLMPEIMTIYLQVCKIERGVNCRALESQSIQMLKTWERFMSASLLPRT